MNVDHKTDSLIDNLASELQEVKVFRHPLYSVLLWLVGAVTYIAFALFLMGVRTDIAIKIVEPFFFFELLLVLGLSVSAAMSSAWLRLPDMRGASWVNSVTFTLLAVFFVLSAVRSFIDVSFDPHFGLGHQCHKLSIIFGVLPAVTILLVSIRGKTTRPVLMSFMNTLSIGGMGYVGLRLVCAVDDMGHLCIFHILPFLALGFVAALVGRRIYSW